MISIPADGKRPVEEEILFFKKRCVDDDILQTRQTMNKETKSLNEFPVTCKMDVRAKNRMTKPVPLSKK